MVGALSALKWTLRLAVFVALVIEVYKLSYYFSGDPKLTEVTAVYDFNVSSVVALVCTNFFRLTGTGVTPEEKDEFWFTMAHVRPFGSMAEFPKWPKMDYSAVLENTTGMNNHEMVKEWYLKRHNYSDVAANRDEITQREINRSSFEYSFSAPHSEEKSSMMNYRFSEQYAHNLGFLCADLTFPVKQPHEARRTNKKSMNNDLRVLRGFVYQVKGKNAFATAVKKKEIFMFSLTNGEFAEESSSRKWMPADTSTADSRKISANVRLHKVKVVGECEEVETEPGKLPALDTPELKCRARCHEKAYADVLNCSYYGFRLPAYNVYKLDFRYGPELSNDTQAEVDAVFKECFYEEECHRRKACEGYYYDFGVMLDNYIDKDTEEEKWSKVDLTMQFDAIPLIVETEQWAMSGSVLFANLGGLIGIFVGVSIFDLIDFLTNMHEMNACRK